MTEKIWFKTKNNQIIDLNTCTSFWVERGTIVFAAHPDNPCDPIAQFDTSEETKKYIDAIYEFIMKTRQFRLLQNLAEPLFEGVDPPSHPLSNEEMPDQEVIYPPCKKCGVSHGMGLKEMATGKIDPLDLCYDCFWADWKFPENIIIE